jgi:hypothetical protein
MPHGRPNARVHLIQIEDQNFSHALLDCPDGLREGSILFLWADDHWLPYRVLQGETTAHAIRLTAVRAEGGDT